MFMGARSPIVTEPGGTSVHFHFKHPSSLYRNILEDPRLHHNFITNRITAEPTVFLIKAVSAYIKVLSIPPKYLV